MTTADDLQSRVDAIPYWYHRIDLPGGIVTPGWAPMDPAAYRIPDDLTDKNVLDVGAWDGYWSFEAAKRGAEYVLAIENFSDTTGAHKNANRDRGWQTFLLCRKALGYDCQHVRCVTHDIDRYPLAGHFDTVFCFGVLYHCQNPMRVLKHLRHVCTGEINIESAILDGMTSRYTGHRYTGEECLAEFYPHDEYGQNHSNWWVPTLRCLRAWVEAAGFKNIENWKLTDNPQHLAHCRGFVRAEA